MSQLDNLLFSIKNSIKRTIKEFHNDEEGAGVIELVLIIVVLIGFVVIFKDKIGNLLSTVFEKINGQASSLYDYRRKRKCNNIFCIHYSINNISCIFRDRASEDEC